MTDPSPADDLPDALDGQSSWYGRDGLWVELPAAPQGGTYWLKYPWVTLDDGVPSDRLGPPVVQSARLDGTGDIVLGGSGGYATTISGDEPFEFWPSGMVFPEPGCWRVTGALGETTVSFVLSIGEVADPAESGRSGPP